MGGWVCFGWVFGCVLGGCLGVRFVHSLVPDVHDWFNSEYRRLGMDLCQAWRITECNRDFGYVTFVRMVGS